MTNNSNDPHGLLLTSSSSSSSPGGVNVILEDDNNNDNTVVHHEHQQQQQHDDNNKNFRLKTIKKKQRCDNNCSSCCEENINNVGNGNYHEDDDHDNDIGLIAKDLYKLPVYQRSPKLCNWLINDILPAWKKDFDEYDYNVENDGDVDTGTTTTEQQQQQQQQQSSSPANNCNGGGGTGDNVVADDDGNSQSVEGNTNNTNKIIKLKKKKSPWRNIRKRVVKEFNECEPILSYVCRYVEEYDDGSSPPITIIDLCSGYGICSMILSEMLLVEDCHNNNNKVSRITLIDNKWPNNHCNPSTGNLPVDHLTSKNWPIPLVYRKRNIKAGRQLRHIHKHDIEQSPGPIILIGIHLCKSLSIRAIQLFHSSSKIHALALKPCCLPGRRMLNLKVPIVWEFTYGQDKRFQFGPEDVYNNNKNSFTATTTTTTTTTANNKHTTSTTATDVESANTEIKDDDDDDEETNNTEGQQHSNNGHQDPNYTNARFTRWVDLLAEGAACGIIDVQIKEYEIQKHHFQNKVLYCRKQL